MITNILHRQQFGDQGTFGVFFMPSFDWFCCTLEKQWKNNIPFISCAPVGTYTCQWTYSNTFKRFTYQIMNVPKRTGMRIHPFNWHYESDGCTAFGERVAYIDHKQQLLKSRDTVKEFEILMCQAPFKLRIQDENVYKSSDFCYPMKGTG